MTHNQADTLEVILKSQLQVELVEVKYWEASTRNIQDEHFLAIARRKVDELKRQIKIIDEIDWEKAVLA